MVVVGVVYCTEQGSGLNRQTTGQISDKLFHLSTVNWSRVNCRLGISYVSKGLLIRRWLYAGDRLWLKMLYRGKVS